MKFKQSKINYNALGFGVVCLALGAMVGGLLVARVPLGSLFLGVFAARPENMAAIGEVFQAYFALWSFVIAAVAALFIMSQLKEMRRSRYFETAVQVDDWIHGPEIDAERRFVISALPSSPDSGAVRDRARTVWDRLQRVARWVNLGIVDPTVIMDKDGDIFVRAWDLFEPYIEEARIEREGISNKYYYQKDFQEFAYRCAVFLKNNHHHIFEKIRAESKAPSRWLEKIAESDHPIAKT